MQRFLISGMSCAACAARIEKAVSSLDGVDSCAVSLLTNEMGVEGTADAEAVISAIMSAGYGASLRDSLMCSADQKASGEKDDEPLKDKETPVVRKRLVLSLLFLLPLMYISMGHMMLDLPLPKCIAEYPVLIGILELVLSVIVMIINRRFFISGTRGLLHGAPNMDTLVAIGAGASFVYSVYALISGRTEEYYFESAAMILTLITVGKLLEAKSKGKTTDALRSLLSLSPKTAVIIEDGKEREIPADSVKKGDIFAVYAGSDVPVDGTVIEGNAAIDESALTGESIPVDKNPGDTVSAATMNCTGYIRCRATAVGENTTLYRIIRLVSDAAATKAPIAKTADKVAGVFVPVVIGIAVLTTVIWLFIGSGSGYAIARGISVLVISCPCALGLATPVAIMAASGKAARNGILFKTAASIEETGRVSIIALDKTGTITQGFPEVTDILPADGISERELLEIAAAIEAKSNHPLAKSVLRYASEHYADKLPEIKDFTVLSGIGLCGSIDGSKVFAGSMKFIQEHTDCSSLNDAYNLLAENGKTPMLFLMGEKLLGIIAVADSVKDDSCEAISELKSMGIRVIMLTGDNERTARYIGDSTGVDEVISGVLPDEKENVIWSLQKYGKVAMVGDGINDAPALTRADVGIAIGAGSDIAIDAADIVLMKGSLRDVSAAVKLGRGALGIIRENLFWAFFYNSIGIPIAAGALSRFGVALNPMIAAACMSLSSFCVVSNALRINTIKINRTESYAIRNSGLKKEKKTMTRTMTIEGMMCPHCESRVKKALEAVPGVISAVANYTDGTAVVACSEDVTDTMLISAVVEQDYEVKGVE